MDIECACVCRGIWIGSVDAAQSPIILKRRKFKTIINVGALHDDAVFSSKTKRLHQNLGIDVKVIDNFNDVKIGCFPEWKLNDFYDIVSIGAKLIHDAVLEKKTPILVHCVAGINRSASVVVGYLVHPAFHEKPKSLEQALSLVEIANKQRGAPTLTQKTFKEALYSFPTVSITVERAKKKDRKNPRSSIVSEKKKKVKTKTKGV